MCRYIYVIWADRIYVNECISFCQSIFLVHSLALCLSPAYCVLDLMNNVVFTNLCTSNWKCAEKRYIKWQYFHFTQASYRLHSMLMYAAKLCAEKVIHFVITWSGHFAANEIIQLVGSVFFALSLSLRLSVSQHFKQFSQHTARWKANDMVSWELHVYHIKSQTLTEKKTV